MFVYTVSIVSTYQSLALSTHSLHLVTELLLFDNMLDTVPASLFEMKSLQMLNLDRNHLLEIPAEVSQPYEYPVAKVTSM